MTQSCFPVLSELCSDLIPSPVIFVFPHLIAIFLCSIVCSIRKNNPKVEIPEFYHICGVRDGSAWARLDFPAESCPAGSPSCCSPAPQGCGSISCSPPSLDFQAQGAGLGLMGFFPPKQNEVSIFLLRRDFFCPVLGYLGRSRERQGQSVCDVIFLPRQSRSICASAGPNLNFSIFFLPALLQGVPQEPAVPRFFSLVPLGRTWLLVPLSHPERRMW